MSKPHASKVVTEKITRKTTIHLDGKDWPIIWDNNFLTEVEDVTGLNMLQGAVDVLKNINQKTLRAMVYAALKNAGGDYSLQDIGKMISPRNSGDILDAFGSSYIASMQEAEEPDPTIAAANL